MTFNSEHGELDDSSTHKHHAIHLPHNRKVRFFLFFLIAFALGFGTSTLISNGTISDQKFQLKTSGIIPLTESELLSVARESGREIYWAGPIKGYSYSLTLGASKSAIVRYLPAKGASATAADPKRAIATYPAPNAWAKSKIAAARPGVTSFINSDGSLVFYDGTDATSIFMAFPDSDIQIEIFDARIGQALSLALLVGQIQKLN